MNEIWKDIEGYEGIYQVSNLGCVKALNYKRTGKEKILKQRNKRGYCCVGLYKDGKQKWCLVHRLVAFAFVDGYTEGLVVNHKDENKQNNAWTNLEWCTQQENVQHSSYKWTGENLNEEVRKKMSDSHKGERNGNYNVGKCVLCVETGEVFTTVTKASKSVGKHHCNIIRAIQRNGTCGGYHWKYLEDYEVA